MYLSKIAASGYALRQKYIEIKMAQNSFEHLDFDGSL